jgi:hypothetical protein
MPYLRPELTKRYMLDAAMWNSLIRMLAFFLHLTDAAVPTPSPDRKQLFTTVNGGEEEPLVFSCLSYDFNILNIRTVVNRNPFMVDHKQIAVDHK